MAFDRFVREKDHYKDFFRFLHTCFQAEKFCDLRIQTSSTSGINCHKIIICSVFPHLKKLLIQNDEEDVIFLPQFTQSEVDHLVRQIYEGLEKQNVEISTKQDLVEILRFDNPFCHEEVKPELPFENEISTVQDTKGNNGDQKFYQLESLREVYDGYENNFDDEEEMLVARKKGRRRQRKPKNLEEIDLMFENDGISDVMKKHRGRKRKKKLDIDCSQDEELDQKPERAKKDKTSKEKKPRKPAVRVSKYELFGASKEEKFPPKFLQQPTSKEKTALQKAVEEFHCNCEPKGFKSYRAKERHYQLAHNADKYVECDLCEAVIVKDNYEEHKTACMEKQKANLCPHCGRQFSTASAVSNHVIYVHNMYSCKKCDVTIRGYSKYRRHHLSVHTDPWHCDQCTAVFSEEAKLKDHFLRVHLPDDQKPCVCEICGKGFLYKDKLNTHMMNKHIRARPYPCRYGCDISYNDRSTRSAHEKKKHGASFKETQANPTVLTNVSPSLSQLGNAPGIQHL